MSDIHSIVSKLIDEQTRQINILLEKAVREHAVPKITGEITKGKIRWRGIRMIRQQEKLWIEQRGIIISPVITIAYKYSDETTRN